MSYAKPLPQPSFITEYFWQGTKRHELLIQRCKDCQHQTRLDRAGAHRRRVHDARIRARPPLSRDYRPNATRPH